MRLLWSLSLIAVTASSVSAFSVQQQQNTASRTVTALNVATEAPPAPVPAASISADVSDYYICNIYRVSRGVSTRRRVWSKLGDINTH